MSELENIENEELNKDNNDSLIKQIETFYNLLNKNIGHNWWKKYITTAFWKNISTPISLSITILTALTTGQIATKGLFNDTVTTNLSIATLLLSTVNTFFRPNTQYSTNLEEMKKWADCGIEFEEITVKHHTDNKMLEEKLELYKKLFKKVNQLKRNDSSNYLTDLIYIVSKRSCLKEENWLQDDNIEQELKNIFVNNNISNN